MRVGIDVRPLLREASGGVVRFIEDLCPALFAAGKNETFFVYSHAGGYQLPGPAPSSVHQVTLADANAIHLDRALARDRVDVLFRAFPSDEVLGFPASRQCVLLPDLQHEDFPQFFSPDEIAARRRGFGAAITRGGAVGLLAHHAEERLHALFPGRSARIVHMPPGPPTLGNVLATPLSGAERSVIPRGPFFLYPANLWEHKNHRRVLAAFARFMASRSDEFSLVLTGSGAGSAGLMENAATLPVRHLGFVSRRLLAELYQRCTSLVYFSLYEGFGLPLLEAFQLGAPVLCSDTTSLSDVGGDAALRCDPTDVEAMAGLMRQIADTTELRQTLVALGRARLGQYDWTRSAENLLASLQELAGTAPRHDEVLDAICLLGGAAVTAEDERRTASAAMAEQAREIEDLHTALRERTTWAEQSLKAAQERLSVIGAQEAVVCDLQRALDAWTERGAAMAEESRLVAEVADARLHLIEDLHRRAAESTLAMDELLAERNRDVEQLRAALAARTAWAEESLTTAEERLEVIHAQEATIAELRRELDEVAARGAALYNEYRRVSEAAAERGRLVEDLARRAADAERKMDGGVDRQALEALLAVHGRETAQLRAALDDRTAWAEKCLTPAEERLEVIHSQEATIRELRQAVDAWTERGAAMADEYRLVAAAAKDRLQLIEQLHGHASAGNGLPGNPRTPEPGLDLSLSSRDDQTGHELA